jgi:hypothetical protein
MTSLVERGALRQSFPIGISNIVVPFVMCAGLFVAAVYFWLTRPYSIGAIATAVLAPATLAVGVVALVGRLKTINLYDNGCEVVRGNGVCVFATWNDVELYCWVSVTTDRDMDRHSDCAKLTLQRDLEVDVSDGVLRRSSELLAIARERLEYTLLTSALEKIVNGGQVAFGCVRLASVALTVVDTRDTVCPWRTVHNALSSYEHFRVWTGENQKTAEIKVQPSRIPNAHIAAMMINILAGYDPTQKKSVKELLSSYQDRPRTPR